MQLYNFADNHDVNRVASLLKNTANLLPLYAILFSMPGVPSIYYGSEFAQQGTKESGDSSLRPALSLTERHDYSLIEPLKRLIQARKELKALQNGGFKQLYLASDQLAFLREAEGEAVLTVINSADQPVTFEIPLGDGAEARFSDLLNPERHLIGKDGRLQVEMAANSSMLLKR